MDLLVGLKNGVNLTVGQMLYSSEADVATDSNEERDLVHKEDVSRKVYMFMEIENWFGNFDKVVCHMGRLGSGGFSFQGSNIRFPYFMCRIDIVNGYGAVLELVALDNPLEILQRWVGEDGV